MKLDYIPKIHKFFFQYYTEKTAGIHPHPIAVKAKVTVQYQYPSVFLSGVHIPVQICYGKIIDTWVKLKLFLCLTN
jgi:hypothetical protein